jgi:hypothetical protein
MSPIDGKMKRRRTPPGRSRSPFFIVWPSSQKIAVAASQVLEHVANSYFRINKSRDCRILTNKAFRQ